MSFIDEIADVKKTVSVLEVRLALAEKLLWVVVAGVIGLLFKAYVL